MKLTAKDISTIVNGTLEGPPELIITGAAGLGEAGPGDVSFIANPRYISRLEDTKAGLLFLTPDIASKGRPAVRVKNPQLAFARILTEIEKEQRAAVPAGVHPSAVVAKSARLGANAAVGPCAVIEENVVIGEGTTIGAQCFVGRSSVIGSNCIFYPRVTVRENITIGSRCIFHPGVVIGSDGFGFIPAGGGIFKIPQIGTVEIEDDVELGANVTVDRATTDKTFIGRGTKIDNLVQVAHNVRIGKNCMIVSHVAIAGSTRIGDNVTIAGQSAVAGHLSIGDGVIVGGMSGVINDVPAKNIVSGFPARPHRETLKIQAIINKLPELYAQIKKLLDPGKQG